MESRNSLKIHPYLAWIVIAAVVLGIAIPSYWFSKPKARGPSSITDLKNEACAKRFAAVMHTTLAAFEKQSDDFFWNILVSDPNAFVQTLLTPVKPFQCTPGDSYVKEIDTDFTKSCENASSLIQSGDPKATHDALYACLKSWFRYRHLVAEHMVPHEVMERDILEARLAPSLFNYPGINLESMAFIAERLAAIYQNQKEVGRLRVALRFAAQARFMDWRANKKKASSKDKLSALELALGKLSQIFPRDPALGEISLAYHKESKDPKALRSEAMKYLEMYPERSTGGYFVAWADYLEGDLRRSGWHLLRILTQNPNDARANYSLAAMDPGKKHKGAVFIDVLETFGGGISFVY